MDPLHAQSPMLENVLNFRDVAETINALAGKSILQDGLLFRSARPDEASTADRDLLLNKIGFKTIIDLRSKTEHINQAKKRKANISSSQLMPQTNNAVSDPVKLPGVHYAEINLNGGRFERALLGQLGWFDLSKLIWLMALGYRNEGISVLGKNVMQPRGLIGLGIDTLDNSVQEIRQIFDILAYPENYPILVHCTQGKDRTGLTILLVLFLLHIDKQYVSADYIMSEKELESEMEERMKEISSIGLDEEFARCPPDFVDQIWVHIQEQYGGIGKYLEFASVDKEMQAAVKRRLEVTH